MPELWLPQVRLLPIQQLRYTVPIYRYCVAVYMRAIYTFSGENVYIMSFAALAPPYPRSALADSYYAG